MLVDGAKVLVTGASSGIGAALAPLLAERGATVGLVARRTDRLDEVLERCRLHTPGSRRWTVDLADTDAAEAVALQAWEEMGGLDVVVHNAAAPKRRAATDLTIDDVRRTMTLNFESPVRMTLALLPRLLERDRGVIVNVSSLGGRMGIQGEAVYSASKFALAGFSESLQLDLWDTGVDVRLILPGAIATEIWDQPDNDPPLYDGDLEPAADVAAGIIAAIEGDAFEHYLPDMKAIVEYKTQAIDDFMAAAVEFGRDRQGAGELMASVNHVGLCVTDVNRARRFYEAVLGFELLRDLAVPDDFTTDLLRVERPVGLTAVYLRRDGFVLELLHFDRPGNPPACDLPFPEPGLTHISFTVDDLAASRALVVEHGGEVLDDTEVAGMALMVRDPDGQLLELLVPGALG